MRSHIHDSSPIPTSMHKQTIDPPRIPRVNNKFDHLSTSITPSLSVLSSSTHGYTHLPFSCIRIDSNPDETVQHNRSNNDTRIPYIDFYHDQPRYRSFRAPLERLTNHCRTLDRVCTKVLITCKIADQE